MHGALGFIAALISTLVTISCNWQDIQSQNNLRLTAERASGMFHDNYLARVEFLTCWIMELVEAESDL